MKHGRNLLGLVVHAALLASLQFVSVPFVSAQDSTVMVPAFVVEMQPGRFGWTELMQAAMEGDSNTVAGLIEAGAAVNATNVAGENALHVAVSGGHLDVVGMLLDAGADVSIEDNSGRTAIGEAVSNGHSSVALELLRAGADPDALDTFGRRSILETAAARGYTEVVSALIDQSVDIEQFGADALRAAAASGESDTVRLLIAAGVDIDAPGGRSALSRSIAAGQVNTARLLLEEGAIVTDTDVRDAIQRRQLDLVAQLMQNIDIGELSVGQHNALLSAADSLDDKSIVSELYRARPNSTSPETRERLLFMERAPNLCNVSLWDPRIPAGARVLAADTDCPDKVFVAEQNGSVFLLSGNRVRSIDLDGVVTAEFELPLADVQEAVENLKSRWREGRNWPESSLDWMQAEPAAIGLTATGEIGVEFSVEDPADGTNVYLFVRQSGIWSLLNDNYCGRTTVCTTSGVDGRAIDGWNRELSPWHPSLRLNPNFVGKERAAVNTSDFSGENGTIQLGIDGRLIFLRYSMLEGSHSDYEWATYLELQIDAAEPMVLLNGAGETAISGRHVLISGTREGPYEVVRLDTGEREFSLLAAATWIP